MAERDDTCRGCGGSGQFLTECCNGAGGCSCRGGEVNMGECRVCHGTGVMQEGSDPMANRKLIRGLHFLGSGPNSHYDRWPNRGHYV